MKKARKILLTLCAALLLVTLSVGATIAYLTDSASVENTFTVGKVKITMDEAAVDKNGELIKDDPETEAKEDARRTENAYNLMPDHEYIKDPIVHVDNDSETCYVFVEVVNPIAGLEDDVADTIHEQIIANGWAKIEVTPKTTGATVYYQLFDKDVENVDYDLEVFQKFTLADDAHTTYVENDTIPEGKEVGDAIAFEPIVITAYAIQEDGMKDAADAWSKF